MIECSLTDKDLLHLREKSHDLEEIDEEEDD